jgi:azurin
MRFFPIFLLATFPLLAQQRDTTITIRATGGLQYDLPRLQIRPGTRLTLVLDNHDDMAHNVVVTQPGARLTVVEQALKSSAADQYVPKTPQVLAATKIVIPGNIDRTQLTLEKEGVYPYVCTYPGHGYVMYGALYVTTKPLPPLAQDPNVPPAAQASTPANAHAGHARAAASPHPFLAEYPLLYRTFVPGASPAAIVVSFDGNLSYCWDAAQCRLRYAWAGGFVDNMDHWTGNGNKLSKIVGDIFWRDSTAYPLRFGDTVPKTDFKGYRLLDRLPQFRYTLDGVDLTETLTALPEGAGVRREFVFAKPLAKPAYFVVKPYDGVRYQPSVGTLTPGPNGEQRVRIPAGTQRFRLDVRRAI